MDAFATVADLEARYRKLEDGERERAAALMGDATAMLTAEHRRVGIPIDPKDELQAVNLKIVCCSMVKRVLASGVLSDVSNHSVTAGPYNEQFTYANPTGNMYLTKEERRILGLPVRRQRIGSFAPRIGGADEG